MKNIYLFQIIVLVFASTVYAQEKNLISGKIIIGENQLEIPKEIKSDLVYNENSPEFTVFNRYSEISKQNVIVAVDSKNKIVCALLPSNTDKTKISKCFTTSFWNGEGGTGWSGFWNCLVN